MLFSIFPSSTIKLVRNSVALLSAVLVLAGCEVNPIYKTTGIVLTNYSQDEATPYVLQMSDTDMACSMGESLDPLVYSFKRVTDTPEKSGALLELLSATCSEKQAWEAELRYLRASYQGEVPRAKDARNVAKRWHKLTAERRLTAFKRAMRAYDYKPGAESPECPELDDVQDELTFIVGVLTGVQAIINDTNSGGAAGVPKSLAPQAERAAQCVDNEKWGGIPNAIRANVWLLLPGARPDRARDPWQVLRESSELSVRAGFRVSMALEVVAAETQGRQDIFEDAIARFAEADDVIELSDKFRLFDAVARNVITFSSDKYWTKKYGHRTPLNQFGRLSPASANTEDVMDLDGIL